MRETGHPDFDAARRAMLEAWARWLVDTQPEAWRVVCEVGATASAMRQITDLLLAQEKLRP